MYEKEKIIAKIYLYVYCKFLLRASCMLSFGKNENCYIHAQLS